MIKNSSFYEFYASNMVPNPDQVGYWIDLGANSKGRVIKVYNSDLKQWVKLTDATSEDAVAPHIGSNGNWYVDNRDTGIQAYGKNPYVDGNNWFVYDPITKKYKDTGVVAKGLTAYEIAKLHGFSGTEEEWLESLKQPAKDAAIVALEAATNADLAAEEAKEVIADIQLATDKAVTAADRANELSDNPMKIIGSYWWKYNETTKEYENTGISATGKGFSIATAYPSIEAMEADHSNPEIGVGEFVIIDTGDINNEDEAKLFNKTLEGWQYLTDLSGSQGIQGMSAYQIALQNGYVGTEAEWVVSLKGAKGDTGATGQQGLKGDKGDTGLQGPQGVKGDIGERGPKGDTGDTGSQGLKGDKGDQGFIGEAGKSPIIQSDTWWVYDNTLGEYVNTNVAVNSDYELTKSKVEAVLTGDITTHNHDSLYYTESEVNSKLSTKLNDAPTTGKQYVRQNGEWIEVDIPEIDLSNYLAKNNADAYTPANDYNPSTKKYVDDNIYSVAVGDTITGNSADPAKVVNVGTDKNIVLEFTIPKGRPGMQGMTGSSGPTGDKGADATINGYNAITLNNGNNITLTNVGSTFTINTTAEPNVQADWNITDTENDSFIKNKPDLTVYATTSVLDTALGNKVNTSAIGATNGVAQLDATGKVPSSQLPSYVDDVLEGTLATFPATGETGKIYVDTVTNKTYRWSGSGYVEISSSLALGETTSTAYSGDKGKAVTDALAAHKNDVSNPHAVTKSQVGLGNVDNTSDALKPISTAVSNKFNNYSTTEQIAAAYVNKIEASTFLRNYVAEEDVTDLNTLVNSGVYALSNYIENGPIAGNINYSQLLVLHSDDVSGGLVKTITQIVTSHYSGTTYIRSGRPTEIGGTGDWLPWKELVYTTGTSDICIDSDKSSFFKKGAIGRYWNTGAGAYNVSIKNENTDGQTTLLLAYKDGTTDYLEANRLFSQELLGNGSLLLFNFSGTEQFSFNSSGTFTAKTSVTAPSFIGNATSATKLQTARKINGVDFDGTKDIETTSSIVTFPIELVNLFSQPDLSSVTSAEISAAIGGEEGFNKIYDYISNGGVIAYPMNDGEYIVCNTTAASTITTEKCVKVSIAMDGVFIGEPTKQIILLFEVIQQIPSAEFIIRSTDVSYIKTIYLDLQPLFNSDGSVVNTVSVDFFNDALRKMQEGCTAGIVKVSSQKVATIPISIETNGKDALNIVMRNRDYINNTNNIITQQFTINSTGNVVHALNVIGDEVYLKNNDFEGILVTNGFVQTLDRGSILSSLSSIPIGKYTYRVTQNASTPMSFTGTPVEGWECIIDVKNNGSNAITQPLPTTAGWQCNEASITIGSGKIASISVRYTHGTYVVIASSAE